MLNIDPKASDLRKIQRLAEKLTRELRGDQMLKAMRDATLLVSRDAKENAPVNTGRLRASITPAVVGDAETVEGVVGSNVTYAPYVELGTRPHYPPLEALAQWAKRKFGITIKEARIAARGIQLKIGARGTPPVRFLQNAFNDNKTRIRELIGKGVTSAIEKVVRESK